MQETLDVVELIKLYATELTKAIIKDGFQLADLFAVLEAPDFKDKVSKAIEGSSKIGDEIKNGTTKDYL